MNFLVHGAATRMLSNGIHKDAISAGERAIALDSNDCPGHTSMANALIYSSRPKEALYFIKRAMRLNPHYGTSYLNLLGSAYFVMEKFEDAATLCERALKHSLKYAWPLMILAVAYTHLGPKGCYGSQQIQKNVCFSNDLIKTQ